jgi:hypothetical protein
VAASATDFHLASEINRGCVCRDKSKKKAKKKEKKDEEKPSS